MADQENAESAGQGELEQKENKQERKGIQAVLPVILLSCILLLLISAVRLYIGGPSGFELVWKGELSFKDTVVDLAALEGIPKREFAGGREALLEQMQEMGLYDESRSDVPPRQFRKRKTKAAADTASKSADAEKNESFKQDEADDKASAEDKQTE